MSSGYTDLGFGGGNFHYKAPVATSASLPSTGNSLGDVRVAEDIGFLFVWNGTSWINNGGSGTVTSVALSAPAFLSVAGSPITGAGTLALSLATQSANIVFAGPTTGAAAQPTFRSLVAADVPSTFVQGPASSANNEIVVFSGTGGKTIKSSGQVLLDPSTRILSYGSQPAFDIPNRYLYTGGGSLGIGVTQSVLYYQDGTTSSVSWNDSRLYDSGGTLSVDWGGEKLYYNSQAVVDWKNQVLFDIGGIISMDWSSQRAAYDSAGIMALSWSNNSHRLLYDSSSVKSQDWEARQQYDQGAALSHDWQVRGFYDGAGVLSLAYESRYLSDEAGNPKLYWNATGLNAPSLTRNTAVYINNSNYFTSSPTTDVELGYLSGTTSAVQTQLNTKPTVQSTNRSTAQTGAKTLTAFTVGGSDASFLVSANVNVTTSTAFSFSVTCSYKDETNTTRVLTLTFSNLAATFLTTITNVLGAGPYEGVPLHIRAKAGSTITIASSGTFTTVTYNIEQFIQQLN